MCDCSMKQTPRALRYTRTSSIATCRSAVRISKAPLAVARRNARTFEHTTRLPAQKSDNNASGTATRDNATKPTNTEKATPEERERRRALEDELRDPKNFLEYFFPRQLRVPFFAVSAISCLLASLLTVARLIQEPSLMQATGGLQDLGLNLLGLSVFGGLWAWDSSSAGRRVERRREVREAQIAFGDREVYVNEDGEKMSRLKEVNDDWILRRLERWGKRDGMPFLGPKKGALLQQLVASQQPRLAVEVGTMAGYTAILIAQQLGEEARLVSIEKELSWVLVAKRFLWQASQGDKNAGGGNAPGQKVEVQWGDARQLLGRVGRESKVDFLLLDGVPKETLEYLKAAEGQLAPGAMVVADNAGVFAEGGMKGYLEYVRTSPLYTSRYEESTLEWRDDVKDGLEVSIFCPPQ